MESGTSVHTRKHTHGCRLHGPEAQKTACRVIGSKWNGDSYLRVLLFSNSLRTYPDSQISQYTGFLSMVEKVFCIFDFLKIYSNRFTLYLQEK